MRPVVLSAVEGKNYILGTFDTTNFLTWWKSEPFPGSVEDIGQITHIFGQYHVCVCKMRNGTYSIYRTKNMGKSWIEVYNTPYIIYTITLIDYGWAIASTSAGWIESRIDSGYTWSLLSSFAPGCKTVININNNVLFAHDGRKVWKSEDYGETWRVVLNSDSWNSISYYGYPANTKKWINVSHPALAGVDNFVLVGFGPYLVISDDLGTTWHTHWAEYCTPGDISSYYGLTPSFGPKYGSRILQIIVTETDINSINCSLIARVYIISNNSVEYWYCGPQTQVTTVHTEVLGAQTLGSNWKKLFTYPYKNEHLGKIDSCEVLKPGSSKKDILCSFSTLSSNNTPIVRYSTTAGYTWNSINASNVTVYEGDPAQEIVSGLGQTVFDEEFVVKYHWVGLACHNKGNYISELNKTVRCISSDYDLMASFRKTKNSIRDILIKGNHTKSLPCDLLSEKTKTKSYLTDLLDKQTKTKSYLVSNLLKTTLVKSLVSYIAIAERNITDFELDNLTLKQVPAEIYYDILLFDSIDKSYSMEMKLIDNHVEEILTTVARYTPQAPDIRYDDYSYVPYDSRTQEVTP